MTTVTKKKRRTRKKKSKLIATGASWDDKLINKAYLEIERIADGFGIDYYPNQIEIITSEQMLDAYSSVGMPLMYDHWSFGKQYVQQENQYRRGMMGLAYEIVINSKPCISYLMEENTMLMQILVMAHACFGHNSFFKGNYLFRQWTDAETIVDYLNYAKDFFRHAEERYGQPAVEELLDSCHSLMTYGVDRYKRPEPLSPAQEKARVAEREAYYQQTLNDLWRRTVPEAEKEAEEKKLFPSEPDENLMRFIEMNSPILEDWQREGMRIVRNIAQYFYPQRQTQLMNEGWATFWHYQIVNKMHEEELIDDGYMLEFMQSHTSVTTQLPFNHQHFSGINVYALGYAMYTDIKRICLEPTEEDKQWFPDFAGNPDWVGVVDFAMRNFKDESFVQQYLSPKVMRDFRLFTLFDDDQDTEMEITSIHNRQGYEDVRQSLAADYNFNDNTPNIQVYNVDRMGDRSLTLRHYMNNRRPIDEESAREVMKHAQRLWGFNIKLESVNEDNSPVSTLVCTTDGENLMEVFD